MAAKISHATVALEAPAFIPAAIISRVGLRGTKA